MKTKWILIALVLDLLAILIVLFCADFYQPIVADNTSSTVPQIGEKKTVQTQPKGGRLHRILVINSLKNEGVYNGEKILAWEVDKGFTTDALWTYIIDPNGIITRKPWTMKIVDRNGNVLADTHDEAVNLHDYLEGQQRKRDLRSKVPESEQKAMREQIEKAVYRPVIIHNGRFPSE